MSDSSEQIIHVTAARENLHALYNTAFSSGIPAGGEEKTLVIMSHNFPGGHKRGHNDLFGDIEEKLAQAGFHTLRYDFRGCGDSEGESVEFDLNSANIDFQSILKWA